MLCLAAAEELGRCTQLCAGQSRVWKRGRAPRPGFHAVAKPESRSRTARPAFLPVLTGAPARPAASRPQHCPAGRGVGGDSESHWSRRGTETAGPECQGEGEWVLPGKAAEHVPRGTGRGSVRPGGARSQLSGKRGECRVSRENVKSEAGGTVGGGAPSAPWEAVTEHQQHTLGGGVCLPARLAVRPPVTRARRTEGQVAFGGKMAFSALARTDPSHTLYIPAKGIAVSTRVTAGSTRRPLTHRAPTDTSTRGPLRRLCPVTRGGLRAAGSCLRVPLRGRAKGGGGGGADAAISIRGETEAPTSPKGNAKGPVSDPLPGAQARDPERTGCGCPD